MTSIFVAGDDKPRSPNGVRRFKVQTTRSRYVMKDEHVLNLY